MRPRIRVLCLVPCWRPIPQIKAGIVHELLPRVFPKRSRTPVWIDPKARFVIVGTGSSKQGDTIASRLVDVLSLVQTGCSPAAAMAAWLQAKQAPPGFSIDRDCELKQPDSEKARVKYARHTLDIDEVAGHIAQSKRPTQLALTWNGGVTGAGPRAFSVRCADAC